MLNLQVPEVVPFRLTHNQVDGFGPLGIEGPYRISCEVRQIIIFYSFHPIYSTNIGILMDLMFSFLQGFQVQI